MSNLRAMFGIISSEDIIKVSRDKQLRYESDFVISVIKHILSTKRDEKLSYEEAVNQRVGSSFMFLMSRESVEDLSVSKSCEYGLYDIQFRIGRRKHHFVLRYAIKSDMFDVGRHILDEGSDRELKTISNFLNLDLPELYTFDLLDDADEYYHIES